MKSESVEVCWWCRRIKAQNGEWLAVPRVSPSYMKRNPNAFFGICPICKKKGLKMSVRVSRA